jgi:SAM-dependent methyltransferase
MSSYQPESVETLVADSAGAGNRSQPLELEYWEVIGTMTRWGRYLAEVEKATILFGHQAAGDPRKCVDIGCGGGRWSKVLADRGWAMTCIDISAPALESCHRRISSAECILVTPSNKAIPCATNTQRIVLCMEAPEVVETDWFIPEVFRVLEGGGILIGSYMNPHSWRGLAWRMRHSTNGIGGKHYAGPSFSRWKRQLLQSGFEMLREESCAWLPFGRESDSLLIPPATKWERRLHFYRVTRFAPWILFVARKRTQTIAAARSK